MYLNNLQLLRQKVYFIKKVFYLFNKIEKPLIK